MNHILFITALQAEAAPLIDRYGLGKVCVSAGLFYFEQGRITCLTTGVGLENARRRLNQFLSTKGNQNFILLNVGIAGGNPKTTKIGHMYRVRKITSENDNKFWLLKNLFNIELPALPLMTVSKGITDGGKSGFGLVDMEGAAIMETAVKFIPKDQILFLKIVSDHMDKILVSPFAVAELIKKQLPEMDRIVAMLQRLTNERE